MFPHAITLCGAFEAIHVKHIVVEVLKCLSVLETPSKTLMGDKQLLIYFIQVIFREVILL